MRSGAGLMLVFSAAAIEASRPEPFEIAVRDRYGTPVEAVRVVVARTDDPRHRVELFTDVEGIGRTTLGGVRKTVDVFVNPPEGVAPLACDAAEADTGAHYDSVARCTVAAERWRGGGLRVELETRFPTRAVCRLTGIGSPTRPYAYGGQDSAITVAANGNVLWWFGDTVEHRDAWILVQNKLAVSNAYADASRCLELRYLDRRDEAALPVAPSGIPVTHESRLAGPAPPQPLAGGHRLEAEDTVWLDLPLVVPGAAAGERDEVAGEQRFRPDRGDELYIGYLSVRDMPELFRINHLGLARYRSCYPRCAGATPLSSRLERLDSPIWFGPPERNRAPEGAAFVDDGAFVILKVADRRPYCAAPPHEVDCSTERPCPDGDQCVRPGRYCSRPPHTACGRDADCSQGACTEGGVIAMRVERDRILDKSAYRYWDAREERFSAEPDRDADAILVDAELGNSVSVMWSTYLGRWIMIANFERGYFTGHTEVSLRTAPALLGPWSDPVTIMENVAGQKSYNPRFVAAYTPATPDDQRVYWTATYDSFGPDEPTHGLPFDYNVFLYETDLSQLAAPTVQPR